MGPLTAISLTGNLIAFIDLGVKLLKDAKEFHTSISGTTEENKSRDLLVREMKVFSSELLAPDDAGFVGKDKQLCNLAEECRNLSTQLVELLAKIKGKNPKSKRASLWSSMKNKYYEKDRQDLEQRLDNYRSQLNLQLNFLTGQDAKARLNDLLSTSKINAAELGVLRNSVDQVRQGVEIRSLSSETQNQPRQLLCMQEEVFAVISQDRILKSLKFEGMYGRFNMVDEAHSKTFMWMFNSKEYLEDDNESEHSEEVIDSNVDDENLSRHERSSTPETSNSGNTEDEQQVDTSNNSLKSALPESHGEEGESGMSGDIETEANQFNRRVEEQEVQSDLDDNYANQSLKLLEAEETKRLSREKLPEWLSMGEGVFHISGKLGSGKSTLMKFLCTRRGTKIELRKWAGDRTLIFANFFFWGPGTSRQKSLPGLYRGLLYSVLKSCPELIAQIFPNIWAAVVAAPWQIQTTFDISDIEVHKAFNRLIEYQSISKNHCFCFFIDGLDEFKETTQYDHRAIAELLRRWTEVAPGNVKLCVSSREYNVFMNMFSPAKRLRLHELTWRDMEIFIQDKLAHIPDSKNREKLVKAIMEKAQGIFLWVALVTKSIRDQLENSATISQMEKELETLPDELDGLYEHILQSLNQTSRRRAYQIL